MAAIVNARDVLLQAASIRVLPVNSNIIISMSQVTGLTEFVNNASNDNVLTKGEKPNLILNYNLLKDEKPYIEAQATLYGITTEKTAYTNALTALENYLVGLSPAYNDFLQDTVINGANLRTLFSNVVVARAALLKKISDISKNSVDVVAQDFSTLVTGLSSDNILSRAEKASIVADYTAILAEKTYMESQADVYSVTTEKTAYTAAITALTTYLGTLSPAYNDYTQDTPIVGSVFRTKFDDVYSARASLTSAIQNKIKQLADNAQNAANTASNAATTANNLLADIASDSKLTPVEKQAVRSEWNIIAAEKSVNNAQASTFSITTENTAYNNAFQALANYLNDGTAWSSGVPTWIADANLGTTTNIVGSTFRANFKAYYDAKTALLNAVAAKAKTLADTAQSAANTANNAIAIIVSDNYLSRAEKPSVVINYNAIVNEQTYLDAQADSLAVSRTAYDTTVSELTTYLTGLSPAYNNYSEDTVIVGSTFRAKFNDVYTQRAALIKGITDKQKANIDGVNTTLSNFITAVTSDNKLARGEKPNVILNYQQIINEQSTLQTQADTYVVSRTAYDTAVTALTTYLTGLTPAYNDLTQDTDIVGTTFRSKFTDVYNAKAALQKAILDKAIIPPDGSITTVKLAGNSATSTLQLKTSAINQLHPNDPVLGPAVSDSTINVATLSVTNPLNEAIVVEVSLTYRLKTATDGPSANQQTQLLQDSTALATFPIVPFAGMTTQNESNFSYHVKLTLSANSTSVLYLRNRLWMTTPDYVTATFSDVVLSATILKR